jgi:hypothetical protein
MTRKQKKLLLSLVSIFMITLYAHVHSRASLLRGHNGIGGEILLLVVPVAVWAFYRCFIDTWNTFKED